MTTAVLYYDPTSEPCRAVHWFAVEASIPIELAYRWLAHGGHRSADVVAINPCHQLPTLRHGDFGLAEASAIMLYLADCHGRAERWVGATVRERAIVHRYLSWYHTNLRQKVTLGYFLPMFIDPLYRGVPQPDAAQARELQHNFRETLDQLDGFLAENQFLAGDRLTVADLLYAPELFALDIDEMRACYLAPHEHITAWLDRLRGREACAVSHRQWTEAIPMLQDAIQRGGLDRGGDAVYAWMREVSLTP